MGLVNMNLLNYLWETGIKPIKNAIAEKLDSSKAANNLLTTEEGFYLDARQGPEIMSMIEEQNSNLSELRGDLTAISKYKDINVTVPNGDIVGTTTVTGVNAILAVSIVYNTTFFSTSAIATVNSSNRVTVKRFEQTSAQTFTVRVVYI